MKSYNAIILGCGRIAGGYDKPGDALALSHAHAIIRSQNIRLAGVYDVDLKTAAAMAAKWETEVYRSIPEIFEKTNPDIVTIAVPDEFHEEVLATVTTYSPATIICEKPLGKDLVKLKGLLEFYREKNINIAVNYNRNYDSSIIQLKKEIADGKYGDLLNSVFYYSKGLRHNGSHAISLLRYLFGDILDFAILDARVDYSKEDPTLDVKLSFSNGRKCYLLAGDESKYSIFEWYFMFSNARLSFTNDGFRLCVQDVTDDPLFPGYKTLGAEVCGETGLKNSMVMLYQNVINNIENKVALQCSADDALETQASIEKIVEHFKSR